MDFMIGHKINKLIRNGVFSIDEVKHLVYESKEKNVVFHGDLIKTNSQRYELFFTKGTKCVCCGIEGKYFAKERDVNTQKFHLNLYAIDKNGNEVLMTKDHIIPASLGGKNKQENYQTMCSICNERKGMDIWKEH